MNILFIARSTYFHFESGGVETHLKNLAEGLGKLHNITILTTSLLGKHPKYSFVCEEYKELKRNGVRYIFLNSTRSGQYPYTKYEKLLIFLKIIKLRRGIGKKNFFNEINKIIQSKRLGNYNIIISQSTAARNIIDSCVPIISIIHGTIYAELKNRYTASRNFKDYIRFFILDIPNLLFERYTTNRRFFKRVDLIIAVSENLKRQFIFEYANLNSKIKVINNGVDTTVFKDINKDYDKFHLLYIGRIEREKGIDITINAVKELMDKGIDIDFIVVGGGEYLPELKKQVDRLNISKNVHFVGSLRNDEVVEYYQKCHIFVFPSRREEGHPMTISESFCAGLPVISSKKGGLKELVINNKTGYLLNDTNYKELADKIFYLYNNLDVLKNFSVNASKLGRNKYSRSKMIASYNEIITKLVEDK